MFICYLSGPFSHLGDSVQFSRSVMPDSATRWNRSMPGLPVHHQLPEFTQTQCPSSRWCHPAILSYVVPFSSCPQSLPASVFSNESTLRMITMCSINFPLLFGSYFWIIYPTHINVYMLTPSSQFLLPVSGGWGLCRKEEILQVHFGGTLPATCSQLPRTWTLQPWDASQSGSRDVTPARSLLPGGNKVSIFFSVFNQLFELEYLSELKSCFYFCFYFFFPLFNLLQLVHFHIDAYVFWEVLFLYRWLYSVV